MQIELRKLRKLNAAVEDRFVQQQVDRICLAFPAQTDEIQRNHGDLDAFVANQQRRAAAYGVVNEQDFELYLDCAVVLGPEFDVSPQPRWMAELLKNRSLTGTEKMTGVHNRLLFRSSPG